MIELLQDYYQNIVRKKGYWLPIAIFAVMGYAFGMVHRTVGIDDLRGAFYGSIETVAAGGFWGRLWGSKLLGIGDFTPFIGKFVALLVYILAGTVLGAIFYELNGRKKQVVLYTVLTSVMITFPLINEIWEYHSPALLIVFLLNIFLAILFQLTWKKERWKSWLILAVPLGIQMAGGEGSFFSYVALVCILLFYQYVVCQKANTPKYRWFVEGLSYAAPLVLALAVRFALIFLMMRLFGVSEYAPYGDYGVKWGTESPVLAVLYLALRYVLTGLLYFPIGVFVVAAFVFVVVCLVYAVRKRSGLPLLLGICVFCGVFIQFIIQGQYPAYRHATPVTVFVAFTAYLLLELSLSCRRQTVQRLVAAGLLLLSWYQSIYLHENFALNKQRSDNELAIVRQIGFRLEELHTEKPVAFVGNPDVIGDYIYSRVSVDKETLGGKLFLKVFDTGKRLFHMEDNPHPLFTNTEHFKYIHTNVNSVIQWAMGVDEMMEALFSYCGYDLDVVNPNSQEETQKLLWDTAREAGMQTFDILNTGEYIIVCLGDLSAYGIESNQMRD